MIEQLLAVLKGVRQTGPGRYMARCPAHDDRSPSLSLRETDDGRILIHCYAGCGAAAVMESLGVSLHDLMPESRGDAP
jgi:DNA primase